MRRRCRVLIVDDEPKLVKLLSGLLELVGFEVAVAMDGPTALLEVQQDPPDLIILDIGLPKLDGYAVCSQLKRDRRHQRIPVIMLTVKGEEEDYQKGMACGADAYLIKPFKSEELTLLVRRMIIALRGRFSSAPNVSVRRQRQRADSP